jgi:hypothetical protein
MRKGQSILSDMIWLVVFIAFAALMFFFFFKPLHASATSSIVTSQLHSTPDFVAAAIPQLHSVTQTNTAYERANGADLIRAVVRRYDRLLMASDAGESRKSLLTAEEYKAYKALLDSQFGYATISDPSVKSDHYAIVLEYNQQYVSCDEYPNIKNGYCSQVFNERRDKDPDTGLPIPVLLGEKTCIEHGICNQFRDDKISIGTAFIASELGPITVIVLRDET